MTRDELILKAKEAGSAEELLKLAKESGIEMDAEGASAYYAKLHKTGEIADDELDNVSGGGCNTSDGHTVVTSGLKCFTGCYESNSYMVTAESGSQTRVMAEYHEMDNMQKRAAWAVFALEGECGQCRYLAFDGSVGYCSKS